jgi:hypothetical protein
MVDADCTSTEGRQGKILVLLDIQCCLVSQSPSVAILIYTPLCPSLYHSLSPSCVLRLLFILLISTQQHFHVFICFLVNLSLCVYIAWVQIFSVTQVKGTRRNESTDDGTLAPAVAGLFTRVFFQPSLRG